MRTPSSKRERKKAREGAGQEENGTLGVEDDLRKCRKNKGNTICTQEKKRLMGGEHIHALHKKFSSKRSSGSLQQLLRGGEMTTRLNVIRASSISGRKINPLQHLSQGDPCETIPRENRS